jgi:hypothetical protein
MEERERYGGKSRGVILGKTVSRTVFTIKKASKRGMFMWIIKYKITTSNIMSIKGREQKGKKERKENSLEKRKKNTCCAPALAYCAMHQYPVFLLVLRFTVRCMNCLYEFKGLREVYMRIKVVGRRKNGKGKRERKKRGIQIQIFVYFIPHFHMLGDYPGDS